MLKRRLLKATEKWLSYHIKYIVEYIIESGKRREKREWKHIINYIVLSNLIIMDTEVSIYREASNLAD
jgi:hypothetical protein